MPYRLALDLRSEPNRLNAIQIGSGFAQSDDSVREVLETPLTAGNAAVS